MSKSKTAKHLNNFRGKPSLESAIRARVKSGKPLTDKMRAFLQMKTARGQSVAPTPPDILLLETGDRLRLEDVTGDFIKLE